MAQRHLRRPGDARPEAESGQELGRKTEVLLDEEGTDDAGQPRDAGGGVDHQRREIRQPHFPAEPENGRIEPAIRGDKQSDHAGDDPSAEALVVKRVWRSGTRALQRSFAMASGKRDTSEVVCGGKHDSEAPGIRVRANEQLQLPSLVR